MTPQQQGRQFEKEIADEFDLQTTPASGAFWFSKLDLFGYGTRWSCKFTQKRSFRLTQDDIDEAVKACQGPGGDGSIPLWMLRLGSEKYDLVIMRKEDFKLFTEKNINLRAPEIGKSVLKRRRSEVPILLREETNGEEN